MQWTPLNTKHSDSLTFDVALIVLALIHKLWCDTAAYEVQGLDMLNIGDNRFIRNVAITVPGYFLSLSRDAGARMTTQEYDCELRRRAGRAEITGRERPVEVEVSDTQPETSDQKP